MEEAQPKESNGDQQQQQQQQQPASNLEDEAEEWAAKQLANSSKTNNGSLEEDAAETNSISSHKRKRQEAIKMVETYDPYDTNMNRAVIRRLVTAGSGNDTEVLTLRRGGKSKAARNKSIATCGHATNGLARLLASKAPDEVNEIRNAMITSSVKRTPVLTSLFAAKNNNPADQQNQEQKEDPTPPHLAKKKKEQVNALAVGMGYMLKNMLVNMRPRERRPYLAVLSHQYRKPVFEDFLGMSISSDEWCKIRKHPNAQNFAEHQYSGGADGKPGLAAAMAGQHQVGDND